MSYWQEESIFIFALPSGGMLFGGDCATFDEDAELRILMKGLELLVVVNFGCSSNVLDFQLPLAGHVLLADYCKSV